MGSKGGIVGAIVNPVSYLTGKAAGTVFDDKTAGVISGSPSGYIAAKETESIGEKQQRKANEAIAQANEATNAAISELKASQEVAKTNAAAKVRTALLNRSKTVYTTALGAADTGDGTGAPVKKKTLLGG